MFVHQNIHPDIIFLFASSSCLWILKETYLFNRKINKKNILYTVYQRCYAYCNIRRMIPELRKSDYYFSRNRPESKFGQFHNLTLDAMDHILCLRRQQQKIALESSIIKIDWHMIRHYKAYLVHYMFSSHLYYFDYFV